MRMNVSVLLTMGALFALQAPFPGVSRAAEGGISAGQAGEDRWVPSLAITGGATIQQQLGFANSFNCEGTMVPCQDGDPNSVPLRGIVDGDDLAVSPFVGGSLELMTPALPVPTRPRLFASGEILPTFAADRELALEGDPGCIHGPRVGDPCVSDIVDPPVATFEEEAANGQGTSVSANVDTLVFGASLGVAFPAQIRKRQLRIKPSVGWINYEVGAAGQVVDAECGPDVSTPSPTDTACTDKLTAGGLFFPGFLRETILEGSASQRFNGIGPGLDVEVDAGRFGPVGVALFLGGRAYRVLGDRTIGFSATSSFDDELGMDVSVADFEVEVDPWIFRAHVGIRFQWLGSPD